MATTPVERVIQVHAKSLKTARCGDCCDVTHSSPPCVEAFPESPNQCRIIVNALRREIDRLLRGFGPVQHWLGPPCLPASGQPDDPDQTMSTSMATNRKALLYAPPSLGTVAVSPAIDAAIAQRSLVVTTHITNLGTLLDALA